MLVSKRLEMMSNSLVNEKWPHLPPFRHVAMMYAISAVHMTHPKDGIDPMYGFSRIRKGDVGDLARLGSKEDTSSRELCASVVTRKAPAIKYTGHLLC